MTNIREILVCHDFMFCFSENFPTMSISVFSVTKLMQPMDYGTIPEPPPSTTMTSQVMDTMHSESDTDSKCSSPVNSHHSESLDIRNASVSSLSHQDILQTMIQSCRRLAANDAIRCSECSDSGDGPVMVSEKCERCAAKKKLKFSISESNKCNTIINEPVKPVLKFSVSAILSGTKTSSDDRILKNSSRNGKDCEYAMEIYVIIRQEGKQCNFQRVNSSAKISLGLNASSNCFPN